MSEWWAEGAKPNPAEEAKKATSRRLDSTQKKTSRAAAAAAAKGPKAPEPAKPSASGLIGGILMMVGGVAGIGISLTPAFREWAWERYIEGPAIVAFIVTGVLALATGAMFTKRYVSGETDAPDPASRRASPGRASSMTGRKFNIDPSAEQK